jgi:hypothetical protein
MFEVSTRQPMVGDRADHSGDCDHRRGNGRRLARRGSALGATLGATRVNNLGMLRTYVDNRERQTRGHEPI